MHSCAEVSGVVKRIESADLSPGGQRPYLPRVRSSKFEGEDYLDVFAGRDVREREIEAPRSFCSPVHASCTVEEEWSFEESDDQYGGMICEPVE